MQNKSCLWHRAFCCVDNQKCTVNHTEYTLNLTAKICVARGVYDVNFVAVIVDGNVFGKDSDASFSFEVITVQDTFLHNFVLSENAALFEHTVNKRCFAMVNVSDDSYIS